MGNEKLILPPKPLKGNDGYKVFSIRIKGQTLARIESLCAASGYSRNELIGILLEYALNNCESGDSKP